jgi:hypothetical protein
MTTATMQYKGTRHATIHYNADMAKEKTIILSFRLPEKLVKELDAEAAKETRSRTNMLQVLVQEALKQRREKESKR